MPLHIKERPPIKFNVVRPRNPTTEKQAMKQTAGSAKPETLQSLSKKAKQSGKDIGGRHGWRPPSSTEHDGAVHMQNNMNRNYEDHFFQISRGHNRGSIRADKRMSIAINGKDFFK